MEKKPDICTFVVLDYRKTFQSFKNMLQIYIYIPFCFLLLKLLILGKTVIIFGVSSTMCVSVNTDIFISIRKILFQETSDILSTEEQKENLPVNQSIPPPPAFS